MKIPIAGFIFGLIAPLVGLFVGLQVSTLLGSLLTFPVIAVSYLLDVPFGNMSLPTRLGAWCLSGIIWAVLFVLIDKVWHTVKR